MKKYIGMNFKEWCALDTEDERTLLITLILKNGTKRKFTSDIEVTYKEMETLRESTITNIELLNNKWYITLKED